jgi:hypothetical protein
MNNQVLTGKNRNFPVVRKAHSMGIGANALNFHSRARVDEAIHDHAGSEMDRSPAAIRVCPVDYSIAARRLK